jgi:predicted flap endonuclease-1-like 5' DNA nuclease
MNILPNMHLGQVEVRATFSMIQQSFGIYGWVWIIIFLVALIIVWWLLTREAKESEARAEELEVHEEVIEEVEPEPEILISEEEAPIPDDLKLIEGIGPKISSLLQEAGITTFVQLANTDISTIDEIIDTAGITMADPSSWPKQAKLAADGEWDALEKFQDELKGGRHIES